MMRLEEINNDFANCDVVYVIGANDVCYPANQIRKSIYGMPVLDVKK